MKVLTKLNNEENISSVGHNWNSSKISK